MDAVIIASCQGYGFCFFGVLRVAATPDLDYDAHL